MKKKVLVILFLLLSPFMIIVTFVLFTNKYLDMDTSKIVDKDSIGIYRISSIEKELNLYSKNTIVNIGGESYQISVKNEFIWDFFALFTFYLLIICTISNIIMYMLLKKLSGETPNKF